MNSFITPSRFSKTNTFNIDDYNGVNFNFDFKNNMNTYLNRTL